MYFYTYLNINISEPRITAKNTRKLKNNPTLVESFKVPSETKVSTKSPPKSHLKSYSEYNLCFSLCKSFLILKLNKALLRENIRRTKLESATLKFFLQYSAFYVFFLSIFYTDIMSYLESWVIL
jgi:hypothetical protein